MIPLADVKGRGTLDKDSQKVLDEAERQGFKYRTTKKGHAQVKDSDGQVVAVLSGTASDVRSYRNGLADLRRAGFIWPPPRNR